MNFTKEIELSDVSKIIAEIARKDSRDIYIVGGYVRDLMLDRATNEMDLLVIGDGIDFAQSAAREMNIDNVTIYKNFGTAHFAFDNMHIEFVGARKESYNRDSRNPHVEPGTFNDDILRRDFTINTLAISLNESNFGELIDTFGGYEDIQNKLIRTPLDPLKTFDDDPLRILRAFRFAAQLRFDVHPAILSAASELKERLRIIAQERITTEFLKIIDSPEPSIGLKLLYETGVMQIVFPEIAEMGGVDQRNDHHHKDVFLHTCQVVDNLAKYSNNTWHRFAALVHDIAKPATKRFVEGTGWTFHGHEELGARMLKPIFKRMKLPLSRLEYVEKLVRLHLRPIALVDESVTDSAIRRLIVAAGDDLDDLISLCRADITSKNPQKVSKYLSNYERVMEKVKEVEEKDKLRAFQSPVKGDEIMEICNLKPSKTVGLIKSAIEDAILDGKISNTYEAAYEYFLKIKDDFLRGEGKE